MGNCCHMNKDDKSILMHDLELDNVRVNKNRNRIDTYTIDGLGTNESDHSNAFTRTNDIDKHDKLMLKVIDSKLIEVGTVINLNYLGLELNGKSDYNEHKLFVTRFGAGYNNNLDKDMDCGIDNRQETKNNGKLCTNSTFNKDQTDIDYILPKEESLNPHHFDIKYDMVSKAYYIKNIGESAVFIKINKKTLLKQSSVIDFGNNQVVVTISKHIEPNNTYSELAINVNHGINKGKSFKFNSNQTDLITFGRKTANGISVVFSDDSTSRLQLSIFNENDNWYIVDSNGEKPSSNGTWILADEFTQIENEMIVRVGSNILLCLLHEVKKE